MRCQRVTNWFMKSGARPMKPKLWSARSLKCLRFLTSSSFLVPHSREELVKKRKHFKLRADHNFGFMGRAPDFMNQFVTGCDLMVDRFARADARFGENATRYYEHVREHDLFLTHMLINPQ